MDPTMWLWLAIGAGILAVAYGVISMLQILALPAGNAASLRPPAILRP